VSNNDIIVRHRGRLFVESGGKRTLLCGMSPKLAAHVKADDEQAIPELNLAEAVPILARGKCPACESRLKVKETGRYYCRECACTFVNTEGYKLPVLMADEIILGSVAGHAVQEFTTVGVASVMPSPMKTKDGTAVGTVCPRCMAELNQRGECGKCAWTPTDIDKLWEQVVRIVERVVVVTGSADKTVEFESGSRSCKLLLRESAEGHKYTGRFVDVSADSIDEIVGRPKAIINFVVERLGSQPVRHVNSPPVNSPKKEAGHRLTNRDSGNNIRPSQLGLTRNRLTRR